MRCNADKPIGVAAPRDPLIDEDVRELPGGGRTMPWIRPGIAIGKKSPPDTGTWGAGATSSSTGSLRDSLNSALIFGPHDTCGYGDRATPRVGPQKESGSRRHFDPPRGVDPGPVGSCRGMLTVISRRPQACGYASRVVVRRG